MSDGFGRSGGANEFAGQDPAEAADGLDMDLEFLDDVESMDVEGMSGLVATDGPKMVTDAPSTDDAAALGDGMTADDVTEFRSRWADVQASFIDDPSRACEQADNLVDLVLSRLMDRFTRERDDLVRKWDRGHEPTDTEDLRVAMKGYRSLIDRLLTAEL